MSMTMIIIISLLVLNLSLTLIMFWILHSALEAAKSLQDSEDILKKVLDLNNQLIEKYNKCLNNVYEREGTIIEAYDKMYEAFESGTKCLTNSYDNILKAYEIMRKHYDSIVDMNTKLLECWKGCEERYSQSYELFKHCSDNLKEVSFQLTDLANVSTEDEYTLTLHEACDTVCLECPDGGLKCHDCPVWRIMHKDSEFLNSLGELVKENSNLEIMQNNEWTDDDYRDAANTHPEDILEGTDDDE